MNEDDRQDGETVYFAYGSNMDWVQMAQRCPYARFIGTAVLSGYRFIINSRGVATVIADSGGSVHGALWVLTREDEKRLDRYEGVADGLYAKHTVSVVPTEGDQALDGVMIYLAADAVPGTPRDGYLERIVTAAKVLRLPKAYIAGLERWLSGPVR
jgi:gamma-glutamylcyclotransferase (GGCT)/AIG2-like uncharacterized protein YtfP